MALEGRVAVITGGANGIGAATAQRFLREGAQVLIGDINDANARQVMADAERSGHGERIRFARVDVSQEDDVRRMFETALAQFGRLDCVFNNAGIGGVFGPIATTRVDDWDYTMGVLLRSVFLGMKHGAGILLEQGQGGCIISTASVAGYAAGSGAHAYSAAKAAIINLTRTVAVELAPHRIRVNAVAPGPVMTGLFTRGRDEQAAQTILQRQPWPEPGNGETLLVAGGLLARGPALFGDGEQSALVRAAGLDKGTTGQPSERRSPQGESGAPEGGAGSGRRA
jgi:NAD(P)-dependent dehydrogenase (short-subunit alcohol dehydrogenase family)